MNPAGSPWDWDSEIENVNLATPRPESINSIMQDSQRREAENIPDIQEIMRGRAYAPSFTLPLIQDNYFHDMVWENPQPAPQTINDIDPELERRSINSNPIGPFRESELERSHNPPDHDYAQSLNFDGSGWGVSTWSHPGNPSTYQEPYLNNRVEPLYPQSGIERWLGAENFGGPWMHVEHESMKGREYDNPNNINDAFAEMVGSGNMGPDTLWWRRRIGTSKPYVHRNWEVQR